MSLWVVILFSFIQFTFGGALGFGLIFMASAVRGYTISQFAESLTVALWFIYCISLVLSISLVIYAYIKGWGTTSYFWFAVPWLLLIVMITYWKFSLVKIVID
ncbi:hypothetical protein AHAT_06030 [Agarivorans sp. Toyoura001]|uniref:hypothetical protein n=1 Tax=Agarivorans sp. Toyoura001 TaxID=2283141 RepID=UPI0010E2988A|nr:hypothetical protein [Agarivorans sp. Toyoura001]GDY24713.1 hypothetical protein AHAT_06030 [Agarivorans sp. Toyoura001]